MYIKSGYLPSIFFKLGQQVLHFVGLPVFFFLFVILFKPFNLQSQLSFQYSSFAFNVSIIAAIIFTVTLITRLILWGLRNTVTFLRRTYLLWCIGETIISALFISLYVHLISGKAHPFIDILPFIIVYLSAILIFPYTIFTLVLESDILSRYAQSEAPDFSRLRFYDERHNLKFVTEPQALTYIEANENYCDIYYIENGKPHKFTIRASLKSLESICSKHGIIRCHRSYLVNVRHIRVLRKDRNDLIRAELDMTGVEGIPVTPRYYALISDMI